MTLEISANLKWVHNIYNIILLEVLQKAASSVIEFLLNLNSRNEKLEFNIKAPVKLGIGLLES